MAGLQDICPTRAGSSVTKATAAPRPRGGPGGLGAGVSAADDDDVELRCHSGQREQYPYGSGGSSGVWQSAGGLGFPGLSVDRPDILPQVRAGLLPAILTPAEDQIMKVARSISVLGVAGMLSMGGAFASGQSAPPNGGYGNGYGSSSYGGSGGGGAAGLASQRKMVADAQAGVTQANQQISQLRAKTETKFADEPEWIAAKKNLADAQAAYDAAIKPVIAALHSDPEYARLATERKAAQASLDAAKGGKSVGDDAVASTATTAADDQKPAVDPTEQAAATVLNDGYAMNKMESEAKANDPKVAEAKQKLDEAKKAMETLRLQVDAALQTDPAYTAAQAQLATAQQQLGQARTQLAQAEKAARAAAAAARPKPSSSSGGSNGYGGSSSRSGGYGR